MTGPSSVDWKMRAELGQRKTSSKEPRDHANRGHGLVRAAHWASDETHYNQLIKVLARTGVSEESIRKEQAAKDCSLKDRYSPLFDAPVIEHYRQAIAYAVDKKIIQHRIN